MQKSKHLYLGVMLLAALFSSTQATAKRGEDWPFVCRIDHTQIFGGADTFKLVSDAYSPTGYTMYIFKGDDYLGYADASLNDTEDHRHYRVSAVQNFGILGGRNRAILAFISKTEVDASVGGVKVSGSWNEETYFYEDDLHPMACGTR